MEIFMRVTMLTFIFFALSLSNFAKENLTLSVTGLKNNRGVVQVAIWPSSNGFPEDYKQATKLMTLSLDNLKNVAVEGLTPGLYAIAIYHDENEDIILNRGAFGIPKEGFGFSNNPRIRFGAPSFEKCAFRLDGQAQSVEIRLNYP
jgi:uncharacterized protein (DUF2141 family)